MIYEWGGSSWEWICAGNCQPQLDNTASAVSGFGAPSRAFQSKLARAASSSKGVSAFGRQRERRPFQKCRKSRPEYRKY
jgi:hypothetical protein